MSVAVAVTRASDGERDARLDQPLEILDRHVLRRFKRSLQHSDFTASVEDLSRWLSTYPPARQMVEIDPTDSQSIADSICQELPDCPGRPVQIYRKTIYACVSRGQIPSPSQSDRVHKKSSRKLHTLLNKVGACHVTTADLSCHPFRPLMS